MNDNHEMQEELFDSAATRERTPAAEEEAPARDKTPARGPASPPPASSMPLPPSFRRRGDSAARAPEKPEAEPAEEAAEPPAAGSAGGDAEPDPEFGARVRALRLRSGMSIEDVSAETLIKPAYLKALEEGDFASLPASVYVTAYLRRVCRLYNAAPAESDELVRELHDHLDYELPVKFAVKVHDLETDEREQRKLRQIVFGVVATAVLFVLILAVAAVFLFAGTGRGGGSGQPFDDGVLLRLQPRVELDLSILPAREPGGGASR